MTTLDWVSIGLYFGLLAGLTWWSVARNRDTADDYFLAGRNLGWVVVGAIGVWRPWSMVVIAFAWIPVIQGARGLYDLPAGD
jgi:Na+/proline symporter